jgi:aldose 1-epimerase
MAFDIIIQEKNHLQSIQLIDLEMGSCIELHTKGALMNSWKVKNGEADLELILGNTTATNFEMDGFRSGKMSPFSCRIADGKYEWLEQQYRFEKFYLGAHAMHGLVYDAVFSILSTTIHPDFVTVALGFDYANTDPGFPFPYEIIVSWTLHQNNFISVETKVKNKSNHSIPLMDGWHPYFTLGGLVNDYTLQFTTEGKIEMDQTMIPTGKIKVENDFEAGKKIASSHFDDCFLLDPNKPTIELSYQNKTILIQPKQHYPYLQIYTPEDRSSIAIENLSGAPNCFNNKMGLQILEPQEEIQFETTYQFITRPQL